MLARCKSEIRLDVDQEEQGIVGEGTCLCHNLSLYILHMKITRARSITIHCNPRRLEWDGRHVEAEIGNDLKDALAKYSP